MSGIWEALGSQLSPDLTHSVIYSPCLVHLVGHVLETLSVSAHCDRLAEPLIEYSRGLLIYKMKHPAWVIEWGRAVHVLVDVSQQSSHTRLLTLHQMDRESAHHYFQACHWLLYQLLEIVVHAIYPILLLRLCLLSTSPLSSLSLSFATYNTLM